MKDFIVPVKVESETLHIYSSGKIWVLWSEFSRIFKIESSLLQSLKSELVEGKHWREFNFKGCGVESNSLLQVSKKGIYQIAYRIDISTGNRIMDFFEDIEVECENQLLDEVESILESRLKRVGERSEAELSEIDEILKLVSNLLLKKGEISRSQDSSLKGLFYQIFEESIRKNRE
jgi:hypothetical protein